MKNTGKKVVQESFCSSLCIPVGRQKHGIAAALLHRRKRSNLVHSNFFDDLQMSFFGTEFDLES